jgi:hypothetical protein
MTLLILGGDATGDALARALAAQGTDAVRDGDRPAMLDAVVILVATASDARPLAGMSDADWSASFEVPLRQVRLHLQEAGQRLAAGGRVILLASTGGMAGVADDVAGCAVEEGARALAKSVALAWQPRGITLVFAAFAAGALAPSSGAIAAVVAPTVRMLLTAPPELGGSTVIADGAVLLAP